MDSRSAQRRQFERVIQGVAGIVILAALLSALFQSWFTLDARRGEQAIVQRFGRVHAVVTESGIHFKLPFGIDQVSIERVQEVRRIEIGFRSTRGDTENPEGGHVEVAEPEHSVAITKDQNLVDADYVVQYEISSIRQYLFQASSPDWTVRQAAKAVMRQLIANRTIDDVLTTGRDEMQTQAKEQTQAILDAYDLGVRVKSVQFQDVHAPQPVIPAFDDVQKAKEEKETAINEGKRYTNSILPKAEGEAKRVTTGAEAYKIRRVNEATGDAARFLALYDSYIKNKELTRRQLYLQTMGEVLPGMEKTIIEGDGGPSIWIPLNPRKEKR